MVGKEMKEERKMKQREKRERKLRGVNHIPVKRKKKKKGLCDETHIGVATQYWALEYKL